MVMELLEGESLRARLERTGRLSFVDTARIVSQVASGLATAHGSGIVHRDLKPDNVMRGTDGRLKILDFGLARISGDDSRPRMTQPGRLVGTPAYMAPEQINGLPVDARADVFAVGVLLYEYACGAHPFEAYDTQSAASRASPVRSPSRIVRYRFSPSLRKLTQ